ncbi:hypothetical protein ALI144C_19075 [Actinosynnema sp. ALI-1.44]|uniref:AfsR/SARP family transcriptional regulator n=1 Tax=Actinosynnema sp. ALI-1.44 TaxID=1933779 RepID=UPI00097CB283|nr:AfsR/SARP family transcriptional regulator [Actinosynnema sp. ALI-1.44]ONI81440.1 hypothetical protein ALI144C_19075 [Actinosynnema sp. ALI-1.44]
MTVELLVLGDVEVRIDGHPVDVGHARQMCVLLALLVDANRAVSVEQLVDRVWGEQPPPRARSTLSGYLTRLRHVLAPAGDEIGLTWRPEGYVLTVAPEATDLHRFRQLVGQARDVDDERALALLDQAQALWRGEAFAHLDTLWLAGVRDTLNRERYAAELDRNDLRLRGGEHAWLLPGLLTQVHDHPLDERLASQLMLALCRAGRQAEALRVFHDTSRRLSVELGVQPGPELRQCHGHVLRGDTEQVELWNPSNPSGRNDLPGDVADFTGRGDELGRLLASFPAAPVAVINGMAGVGKTTLAIHAAHRLVQRFPDAVLFVDLHGHSDNQQAVDPMAALDTLLRAIGVPDVDIPSGLDARAARWRSELADRAVLLVLDDAAGVAQIRPLMPGGPRCLTLITSRRQLPGLDGARVLSLDVLPHADAVTLFTRIAANHRRAAPEAVAEVIRLCGHLPLAVRNTAARLRTRPTWTVAHLLERLRPQGRRLVELAAGDRCVSAAFALSYNNLTPPVQRLFRLLGLYPGREFDACVAAALADVDLADARRSLEALLDVHLLQQTSLDRYHFHDLLRAYAAHLTDTQDTEAVRNTAQTRLLDHYLHSGRCGHEGWSAEARARHNARNLC